jgi:hypothetical protein
MTALEIKDIDKTLKSTGSRIAFCDFFKKNGERRRMKYKCVSARHCSGVGAKYDHAEKRLTPVFDMEKCEVRTIYWDQVLKITIAGKEYHTELGLEVQNVSG